MPGSYGTPLTPLAVGTSDSGDFSSYLGRPLPIEDETYIVVQANVAIATGSNGKQLVTAISSGQASWSVSLATGLADNACCAVIPWTHTAAIASGAYFLALRDSAKHVMLIRGTLTGAMEANGLLCTGTGSDLINILTGTVAPVTGLLSTSSGIGFVLGQMKASAGKALIADTGIATVSGWVQYKAPFRAAD